MKLVIDSSQVPTVGLTMSRIIFFKVCMCVCARAPVHVREREWGVYLNGRHVHAGASIWRSEDNPGYSFLIFTVFATLTLA